MIDVNGSYFGLCVESGVGPTYLNGSLSSGYSEFRIAICNFSLTNAAEAMPCHIECKRTKTILLIMR